MFLGGKKMLFLMLVTLSLAQGGSFETACVSCHTNTDAPDLESFYFRYLLKYGSQKRALEAMQSYLLAPTFEKSLLPPMGQKRFGLHPAKQTSDAKLEAALAEYFRRYDVKGRATISD